MGRIAAWDLTAPTGIPEGWDAADVDGERDPDVADAALQVAEQSVERFPDRAEPSWTRNEVESLLTIARTREPRLRPALSVLFSTGLRRGELLGLKSEDIDFERRRIHVRRALVRTGLTSPKNGKGRFVAMPPALGELLLELLGVRRRQCLGAG